LIKKLFISKVAKAILASTYNHEEINVIDIAREFQIFNYSMIVKQRKILEDSGLIQSSLKGRQRFMRITDKGRKFFEHLKGMEEIVGRDYL